MGDEFKVDFDYNFVDMDFQKCIICEDNDINCVLK